VPLPEHENQKRGTFVAEAPVELAGEHWSVGVHVITDVHARLDNWPVQLAPATSVVDGQAQYSPSFQATDGSRWQVVMHDSPSKDSIGLYVKSLGTQRESGQLVNFSITIHNHLSESLDLTKDSGHRYDPTHRTRGWKPFRSRADLQSAGFLRNGILTISAAVDMRPYQKLRLALTRHSRSAGPLLANLSITPIDGAAPQDVDNVEYFEPLSGVDSVHRYHQFRTDHKEASVWMDADRLNETGTSFLRDGSLLVMVGLQLQPVADGTFTWIVYDFNPALVQTDQFSHVFRSEPSQRKWCAVATV